MFAAPQKTFTAHYLSRNVLGGNANGDFEFKPFLIYQSENPRALKGSLKIQLSVH
jgi:hypothetical protein